MSIAKTKLSELLNIFELVVVPFEQFDTIKADIEYLINSSVFEHTSIDVIGYYLNYQTSFGTISLKRNDFEELAYLYSHDILFRRHVVESLNNLREYVESETKYKTNECSQTSTSDN
jgi:hypothetical protein